MISAVRLRIVRFAAFVAVMLLVLPAPAKEKVSILNSGSQPGHYLQWNGKPILPIGDSVTQGWMECGLNFDQEGYIDALSARDINVAMIWSYIATDNLKQTDDARIGYDAPEIIPWQGSTQGNMADLLHFNQAYFDRLKSFVSYAESKGVLVLITVHDGWTKTLFNRHPFNASQGNGPLTSAGQYVELADYDNEMPTTYNSNWNYRQKNQYFQERFADKLITELEPYSNVIYEMFNEGEWYDHSDRREHEEHFLRFFNSRTDALLMTNADHVFDGYNPHQVAAADIVSLHGGWTGRHAAFVSGFNKTPAKPYFQSEAIPEYNGTNMSVSTLRRSAWEQAMAGAGWVAQNDTSFGWDSRTAIASQSAKRNQAYDQIGHVASFFNQSGVKFWNMAPDPSLCDTGICLADKGDEYLVYAASGGGFSVNLSHAAGKPVRVQWYNPRTGQLTTASPITASASASFTAPDTNDWVLRLTITPELPGDANDDGRVDVVDLGTLATNYDAGGGFAWEDGDFTGDGRVDVADLGILSTNYGASSNSASSNSAVPEPGMMGLLGGVVLMCLWRRRGREAACERYGASRRLKNSFSAPEVGPACRVGPEHQVFSSVEVPSGRRDLLFPTNSKALLLLVSAMVFSISATGMATADTDVTRSDQIEKWRRHVVSLENGTYTGNPFELEVDAVFTHAISGKTISLPGYYAGNDTWKFGFMPTEQGQWTYVTSSSDPDLDARSGQLTAVASQLPGLLASDPDNSRKWKFSDGGYVIPIALRNEFFCRPANENVFIQAADFQHRNNLLMMETRLTEEYGLWEDGRHDYIFEGDWQNHQFDLDVWERMESRMEALTERGLGAHIMIYSDDSGKPGWSGRSQTEALVLRYIMARLAGYPVVVFNTGIDISEYRSQEDVDWMGARMRALDPYDHPVSSRENGGIIMSGETFASRGDTLAKIADMTNYFNNANIPVSMDDAWGEERPSHPHKSFEPEDIRRAFWKCVMAGGTGGLIRGSQGMFGFLDVEQDLESEQWLRLINPFVNKELGETFGSMVPAPSLVENGYALADPARSKILYFMMGPNDKWDAGNADPVTLKFAGLTGVYQGFWFNPRSGEESAIGTLASGSNHSLNLPSDDDWVLLMTLNPQLPGDANDDGCVDVIDLGILATNYGAGGGFGWAQGDFTGDRLVDVEDLGILATRYGTSLCSSIPEPNVMVFLSGLILAGLWRRKWHAISRSVVLLVAALGLLMISQPARAEVDPGGLLVQNGWYCQDGAVTWGYIQHNGWWRAGQRPNLTRRAPVDGNVNNYTNLDVRPNRTEDLGKLTDNMERYGYPGFEHNYGLWFDRRRDAHDTAQRTNPNVVAPFLEQPWARSGTGTAWDGLAKYDLTQFNQWYFQRLADFADLSDAKGTVLFHNSYMQHALLEIQAHYADFPWRPENCIQNTGMPSSIPAANAFYDVSNPVRRDLHRLYIRKTLDELGSNTNVVYLPSQEYTGPKAFVEFWLDTIVEWEGENDKQVHIGLGATKDVLDAVLADPGRGPEIDTIDLRYWWIQPDGSLYAPAGGAEVPGRYAGGNASASVSSAKTTPQRIYEQVRQYRDNYPDKAIIHAIESTREQTWAFFMAGGSMLVHGQIEYPGSPDVPPDYVAPPDWTIVRPLYELLGNQLSGRILDMRPVDLVLDNTEHNWALADNGSTYLAYSSQGETITLNLSGVSASFDAQWFDPRTGTMVDLGPTPVEGGYPTSFAPPSQEDWALLLHKTGEPWGKPTGTTAGWEFDTPGDREGWTPNSGVTHQGVSEGKWKVVMSGADPYLVGPTVADPAENALIVEIAMSSTDSNTLGQLFWLGAGDTAFSEGRSRKFTVLNDGRMHRYWFDLTGDFDGGGALERLRLDPAAGGNGGLVTIDYIRILGSALPGDANGDGSVDVVDLGILATNYDAGSEFGWGDADFNGDGAVDVIDLGILATNYGASTSSAAVPEPSALVLLAGMLLAGSTRHVARGCGRISRPVHVRSNP